MIGFRLVYLNTLGIKLEKTIKAICKEMAEIVFSNNNSYSKIIEVKEV